MNWDAIGILRQFTVLPRFVEVKRTPGKAVGYAGLTRTAIDGPILPCFTARVGCARRLRRHEFHDEKRHAFAALAAQIERIVNPPKGNVRVLRG